MYRRDFLKLLCSKSIPGIGFLIRWAGSQLPDSWSSEGIVAQHYLVLVMAAGISRVVTMLICSACLYLLQIKCPANCAHRDHMSPLLLAFGLVCSLTAS